MIITKDANYHERFKTFIKYHSLNVGDTFQNYQYINWISKNLSEFKKIHNMGRFQDLNDKQQELFATYLSNLKNEYTEVLINIGSVKEIWCEKDLISL